MEDIFDHLFKFDSFSYTLYADKPISFENICTSNISHISLKNYCILFSYKKPINFLETSWNIWQSKYSNHKFNNYIFFEKRYLNYITIILINKKAFSKTFEMNKEIFQKVLGNDLTEEKLLSRILCKDLSLNESLNNHQGLLGILLGYGTHNSMLFQEKYELLKFNSKFLDPGINRNKLAEINKKLLGTNRLFCWLNVIQPVRFSAEINHSETKELIKKYSKKNTEISSIYKRQNFLNAILSKLNE